MTYSNHYNIIEYFHCPKNPLCFAFSPPTTTPLGITDLFIVSIVLSFLECYIVGIIQYIVFSDWLLSLSDMHRSEFLTNSLVIPEAGT